METLRDYALEKLTASGEVDEMRRRHAAYYVALAESAAPYLMGSGQIEWLTRLRREHENIRTVLRWAHDRGEIEASLRMLGALWRYWQTGALVGEGRVWLNQALADAEASSSTGSEVSEVSDVLRAKCYHAAGALA